MKVQKILIKAGTIASAVGLLLCGLLIGSASAATVPTAVGPHVSVKSYPLMKATQHAAFAKRDSNGFIEDDPPGGGCKWNVQFSTTANYIDGTLADTETPFAGVITCSTTAAGQTMQHMSVDPQLWINSSTEKDAGVAECSHLQPSDSQCLFLTSDATDHCFAVNLTFCNGDYFAQAFVTILLPSGWVWTSAPAGCTINASVEIDCKVVTNTVPIPEFD